MRSVTVSQKRHTSFVTLETHSGRRFLEKCHSVTRGHVQFNKEHVRETCKAPKMARIL